VQFWGFSRDFWVKFRVFLGVLLGLVYFACFVCFSGILRVWGWYNTGFCFDFSLRCYDSVAGLFVYVFLEGCFCGLCGV